MIQLTTRLKKPAALLMVLLCSTVVILGQSSNQNYILTKTMLDNAGTTSFDKVDYYDGLGRPVETVLKKATPGQKDIVTLQEYDGVGRPSNSYIPVPASTATGAYVDASTLKTASNSFYGDSRGFEETVYEASPLNRIDKVYGPGAAWYSNGKPIATGRYSNSSSGELSCALYTVASVSSLQRKGLYAAGELYVTKTTGEDEHIAYTFTDKLGRVVLERVMDGTIMNDTYYVYDDFGSLRYVLPPSASELLTATTTWADSHATLVNYAYIYKYEDARRRCTRKVLPGCDSIRMRYDKADRLIFSQDGEQRSNSAWTFYLYDVFGRPAVTGVWVSSTVPNVTGTVVKATYDAGGTKLGGYTVNLTLPATVKLMTVNYYDDYAFLNMSMSAIKDSLIFLNKGYDAQFASAKGLFTGARTYQLSDPSKYSVSAIYYDHRGRVVQSRASNHVGGYDGEYFMYTFTGKVKQRMTIHSASGNNKRVETYYYNYGTPSTNPSERLLDVKHKLSPNTAQTTLAVYSYDDVGRVKTKKLGTETSTYTYNVRSWLTQMAGTKFNQTLTYNTAVNGVTPSKTLYNGNISAMKWKAGDETTERGYKFTYDNLGRLTAAAYGEGAAITSNLNRFNENVTYNDKMGNIKTLQRQGRLDSGYGVMDNLTYTYTGNKLTKVSDAATAPITYPDAFHFVDRANVDNEYTYDKNGNLKKDLNKNITLVTYNALNLPGVITYSNNNTVTYVYDGAGNKLSVAYYNKSDGITTKTEYVGNKVYKNGTLSMVLTEEGYATVSGTPVYYYYLKDHQGNNRVVINQGGGVQQVNHYYPFGGLFGEGIQTVNQSYKYNGKELDRINGLDMYDFHWRQYMADLGRTTTLDPHAENYYSLSPYSMFANNPVLFIDPDGRDWYRHDEDEAVMWKPGSDAVDGYSNIGTHYTLDLGNGISLTFNQNTPETMVETVLNAGDWETQMTLVVDDNGRERSVKKAGEAGNCFYQAGQMVRNSGATSLGGTDNNINTTDGQTNYMNAQIEAGNSVRVHVDYNGDGVGDHWVAISSRTTNLQTQTSSYNFFDPGTVRQVRGTHPTNIFNVTNGNISGITEYSGRTYRVTAVRRNQ